MEVGFWAGGRSDLEGPDGEEGEEHERGRDGEGKDQEFRGLDRETPLPLHVLLLLPSLLPGVSQSQIGRAHV